MDTEERTCETCSDKTWCKWKYPCSGCVDGSMWTKKPADERDTSI